MRQSTVRPADAPEREPGAPPRRWSWSAFALRFVAGATLFWLLTMNERLLSTRVEGGLRVYAVVLGGLLLALAWGLLPRLDPTRRRSR